MENKNYTKEVHTDKLSAEIENALPGVLDYIMLEGSDDLKLYFTKSIDSTEESTIDGLVAAHDKTVSEVKIHRLMKQNSYDTYTVPKEHDYKRGLDTSLFPVRTFIKGELQKVEWYADQAKTDLILKTDITYNRDSLGFVTDRIVVRTWLCEDGTDHPDKKITIKEYTQKEAIAEGVRRRTNVVDDFQQPAIGLMIQAAGMTPTDAVMEGSRFMESISKDINSYIHTPRLNHFQTALTNATETWLDADIGGGVTIRDYLIDFITIPA